MNNFYYRCLFEEGNQTVILTYFTCHEVTFISQLSKYAYPGLILLDKILWDANLERDRKAHRKFTANLCSILDEPCPVEERFLWRCVLVIFETENVLSEWEKNATQRLEIISSLQRIEFDIK